MKKEPTARFMPLSSANSEVINISTHFPPSTIFLSELLTLIPHRYPFLFLDRIENMVLAEEATGIKCVTVNEWFFQGHFPSHPIMPGVLIIEALAQTAAALVVKTLRVQSGTHLENSVVYFMSVEEAKFRRPVYPGCTLQLHVVKERSKGSVWKFRGRASVDEKLCTEATFMAKLAD